MSLIQKYNFRVMIFKTPPRIINLAVLRNIKKFGQEKNKRYPVNEAI
jgi:hypothetical protein